MHPDVTNQACYLCELEAEVVRPAGSDSIRVAHIDPKVFCTHYSAVCGRSLHALVIVDAVEADLGTDGSDVCHDRNAAANVRRAAAGMGRHIRSGQVGRGS